ncbi:hypothetical protein SDC9_180760 [bioreactor metagenome]|uniref:Uncharacterized protein n=1 Tax=bioreactor metagenome TaxID=1076179 RepID=A0A645H2M8_9ZZZZ
MAKKQVFVLHSAEDEPRLWEVKCPMCLKLYGKTVRPYSKREIKLKGGTIHDNCFVRFCSDCECEYGWGAKIDHADYDALHLYDLQTGKIKKDIKD